MKIGLDIQVLQGKDATGYGYYIRGLYDALRRNETDDVKIVGLESKWDRGLSTPERFWHDRFEFAKVGESADVDILHQPAFSAPKSRKKVVWTLHDLRPVVRKEPMSLPARLYWRTWLPYSARYADQIVCTSQNTVRDAETYLGISGGKIKIIPLGLPEALLQWRYKAENGKAVRHKFGISGPYFATVGTIQPIKNFPFLVDAFVAMKREHNLDHQLVIIGKKGWDYDNVKARIAAHNLEEGKDVIITDYVTDDEKWSLIHDSDAFLFPSQYEGFGIPPLEAQAIGVPVLCADNSSLPDVVGDGAVLCETMNANAWVKGYAELIKSRDELVKAGKTNITRFDWDDIAKQWIELYQSLA
jgi:glycosyltransferase involved in cell wall biosynthesis